MYIKESICISPQETFPSRFATETLIEHQGNKYFAVEPSYEGLIPMGALRRMGKAVRMGVAAGTSLLRNEPDTDGIIIGTANGGLEDCIKFLNQIVDYNEGTLTPTNFVQSTPNALAGQLALIHKNHGYNITHSHGGLSFENAVIDAFLQFEQQETRQLLVGSIEEISEYNYAIDLKSGLYKEEMTTSKTLLSSNTKGTVCGEGAAMFLFEKESSRQGQIRIADLSHTSYARPERLHQHLNRFLERNGLNFSDIEGLILGYNGDEKANAWYDGVKSAFPETVALYTFKNACGEYPTASSFALWMAQQILQGNPIPDELILRESEISPRKILIYNHYRGIQHSFILLDAPSR